VKQANDPPSGRSLSAKPVKTVEAVRVVMGAPPVEPALVSITSRSHDEVLEYTHAFAVEYARRRFRSGLVPGLSVAAYELLANALNYGSALGEVVFQVLETPQSVTVSVQNETMAARLGMLTALLERLKKDPEATFLEEMNRSVSGGMVRPMLGLARIVHEAKMSLEVYMSGSRLTVFARSFQ
jgi:hypothetical protein